MHNFGDLANRQDGAAGPNPGNRMMTSRQMWLLVAIITVAGAILRFLGLDWQSLWLDEASSLRNAHAFGREGIQGLAHVDQIAPLHSVVLWLSTSLGGDTEFAIRLPSVIAGILSIPLTFIVAKRMFGSRSAALVSAALVALSPFAIWFSQEGRMYALLLLAGLAYIALVWPIVERPLKMSELVLLTLCTTLGLGMHHYMALLMLSFGLFLLIKDRTITKRAWAWGLTQIVASLIFSYWMLLTIHTLENPAGNAKPGFLFWVPYAYYSFVAGFSFGPSTQELASAGRNLVNIVLTHAIPVLLLAVATMTLIAFGVAKALRSRDKSAALWLLIWLVGPVLLSVIATFISNVQFNVRYVIISFPPLMILLALGIAALPWSSLRRSRSDAQASLDPVKPGTASLAGMAATVVLTACLSIATINLYTVPGYAKTDSRSLARFLRTMPPNALLATDNNRVIKMLKHYGGPLPELKLQVDYRTEDMSPERVVANMRRLPANAGDEIWLIEYRSWEADPNHLLRAELDRDSKPLAVHTWPGVTVRRYRPTWIGGSAWREARPSLVPVNQS